MSGGGLPRGRITAVTGGAGAGKTVFSMQSMTNFVKNGGDAVFVSFEQSPRSVLEALSTFAWDAGALVDEGRIQIIDARLRSDIVLSGVFDIGGLLASITGAVSSSSPACVVFDGIDALLTLLDQPSLQRAELLRLQEYAESLSSTVIVTLKLRPGSADSFEDIALYMADCVLELERGTEEGLATRNLRIQKYRSSAHAQSRVPFIMSDHGIEIATIAPLPGHGDVSHERLLTGIPRLDAMLGGGFFRGSSSLFSGAPGTAKTTLGSMFLHAACEAGEPALGIFFDESPAEIIRNVASVGIDLSSQVASGRLILHGMVDRTAGPDELVHEIAEKIRLHRPRHLLIDPVSIFTNAPSAQNAVRRLIQLCKREAITVVMTSLLDRLAGEGEATRSYVSTLCDNWIHLSYLIQAGERNRGLTIVKSRGTAHSNQVAELLLDDTGISIADVYAEDGAVLMGSLRWQKERLNEQALQKERSESDRVEREMLRSIEELELRQSSMTQELFDRRQDLVRLREQAREVQQIEEARRGAMLRRRGGETAPDRKQGAD
ncbi:circadian clock protein KaiC [Kaistia soli DSM 19436]|uniref:Circadian clock protein KaiC n=2 Tax=Kaistia TaxID=166953 RepID=A0A1M5H7G0_9HYPH|nr:circadian clock protein KaiC [Kaistia soli DSM 19436]